MTEGYKPTPEEIGLAEEMMTDEQRKMSNEREKDYDISVKSFDLLSQFAEAHTELVSPEARTDLINRLLEISNQCVQLEQAVSDKKQTYELLTAILGGMKEFYAIATNIYKPLSKDVRSLVSNALKISKSYEGTHKEISDRFQNDVLSLSWPYETFADSIQIISETRTIAKQDGITADDVNNIRVFLKQASHFVYGMASYGEMLKELLENREEMIRNGYSIAYGENSHRRSPFATRLKTEIKRDTDESEASRIVASAKPMQEEWEKDFNILVDQGVNNWPEMRS